MPFRPPPQVFNLPPSIDRGTPQGQFDFQTQQRELLARELQNPNRQLSQNPSEVPVDLSRLPIVGPAVDLLSALANAPGTEALIGGPMATIGPIRGLLTQGKKVKDIGNALKSSKITARTKVGDFGGTTVRFDNSSKVPKTSDLKNIIETEFPGVSVRIESRRGGLGGVRGDTSFHINLTDKNGIGLGSPSSKAGVTEEEVVSRIFGPQVRVPTAKQAIKNVEPFDINKIPDFN